MIARNNLPCYCILYQRTLPFQEVGSLYSVPWELVWLELSLWWDRGGLLPSLEAVEDDFCELT
jgi:hypothetical protein